MRSGEERPTDLDLASLLVVSVEARHADDGACSGVDGEERASRRQLFGKRSPVIGHIAQASANEPFLALVLELRPANIAALLLETTPVATARPGAVDATLTGIAVSDASPAYAPGRDARSVRTRSRPGG
jgi:hypothetical protein